MLKVRALRKIFITTLTAFIILAIYSIENVSLDNTIKTNLELEYITGIGTNNIYLLDENNYLVKSKILLDKQDKKDQIKMLLNNLTINSNSKIPSGLRGVIPEGTKIQSIMYDEEYVSISFNKKILKVKETLKERMVESIIYSIMDLGGIKGIILCVDDEVLPGYEKVLDKSIGINKVYNISSRNDISKVVVYYLERLNNEVYYVPVTRYLNDSREKVEIIIEQLASSYIYEPNLMSFVSANTKLLDYKEQENIMILNFNNAIFSDNNSIVEEVKYTIAYSIFDNYDVNQVLIEVNNSIIDSISR